MSHKRKHQIYIAIGLAAMAAGFLLKPEPGAEAGVQAFRRSGIQGSEPTGTPSLRRAGIVAEGLSPRRLGR